jgi:hypothetical protein
MLTDIDPRFPKFDSFRRWMRSVSDQLLELQSEYPDRFEAKYLAVLPAIGFFVVDPSEGGLFKIEIYPPRPWPSETRPHFIVTEEKWRDYFSQMWANYWALAAPAYRVDG